MKWKKPNQDWLIPVLTNDKRAAQLLEQMLRN
jgi:hypothetical protein